jgi:Lon protease-like protein
LWSLVHVTDVEVTTMPCMSGCWCGGLTAAAWWCGGRWAAVVPPGTSIKHVAGRSGGAALPGRRGHAGRLPYRRGPVARYLPVFPLGSVIVPTQILPLHVFEERYRILMETLTEPASPGELGVVLIERGSEVGGGEVRVRTGTVAHLIEAEQLPDGRWVAVFAGSHRFTVEQWLADDPFPQAEVTEIADGDWDPGWGAALAEVESSVRSLLRMASEMGQPDVRPAFALSPEPNLAAWQLCALAPVGAFDRQRLLEAGDHGERLRLLSEQVEGMAEVLAFRLRGE